MDTKEATAVWIRREMPKGIMLEYYEVGKKASVPVTGEKDMVLAITLSNSFTAHIEIWLENWGKLWIIGSIEEIHFIDAEYRKAQDSKKQDKSATDTSGKPQGVNQDAR